MTCIVGLKHKGKVYIGADSVGSNGYNRSIRVEPKVFKNGDFLIGGTTSFRMLNLLQWKFNPPTFKDGDNLHRFMCVEFVDSVRKLFSENGFRTGGDDWKSGTFLVGVKGSLFKIENDFQVSEHDFTSCGCGEDFAVACLYSVDKSRPKQAIIKALECAEHFSVGVGAPFIIDSV